MAKLKKIPKTDLEYVEFYSLKLKQDSSLFKQQNQLINSQINSSKNLFRKIFGAGKGFKKKARKYLNERGIIK